MACVSRRLVDHVNQDPAKVDRAATERRHRGGLIQRGELRHHRAAAIARRRVQIENANGSVVYIETHGVVGVVRAGCVPRSRRRHPEHPTQEPTVLGPCKVLDDPGDRHIGGWQDACRGAFPRRAGERRRDDHPIVIQSLLERSAFVRGLEVGIRSSCVRHVAIVATVSSTSGPRQLTRHDVTTDRSPAVLEQWPISPHPRARDRRQRCGGSPSPFERDALRRLTGTEWTSTFLRAWTCE